MNRIDELIKKLCPNGVEYKKASEIKIESFWLMPSTPTYIADGVPYITSKNIKNGKINFENVNYISEKDYLSISSNRTIKKNDLLITMIGTIGETAFVEEDIKFYGQNMYLIRLNEKVINRKFFNYYLTSEKIKNSLVSRKNTSSQGYIKAGSIENLLLPVPPLEVQCEIVHILDNFTLLSAELSTELKARQMQYEYYRNRLIKETNKVECKNLTLEDILKIKNGKDYKHLKKGKYPVYGTGGVITYVDDFVYNKPSVLIPRKGSLDKIYYVEEPFWNVDTIFYTEINENEVIPKYVYYYLQNEHLEKLNIAGGIPSLTQATLNKVKITIPSKDIQKSVVEVLDNFDKICNSLMDGLPAEIEARQKQYEYYRDKLLTFKELKVNE